MPAINREEAGAGNGDTAAVALELWVRGWKPVPLEYQTKRPRAGFPLKEWYRSDLSGVDLREEFRDPCNIGVALGEPSGGLTCRDFDRAEDFEDWRERHPHLANTAPTVRTGRGAHVYFLTPAKTVRSYCRPGSSGTIIVLPGGSGEVRRSGHTVFPPSVHPSGAKYHVEIDGDPPFVSDLRGAGLIPPGFRTPERFPRRSINPKEHTPSAELRSCVTSPDIDEKTEFGTKTLDGVIVSSLPHRPGERHRCLFSLIRYLAAHPETRDADPRDLGEIVKRWHRLAYPVIKDKAFWVTWREFLDGWRRCRIPAGATIAAIAAEAQGEGIERLADLSRLLQVWAGDRPFFLDCRSAGEVLGVSAMTISRWLRTLRETDRIKLVRRGDHRRSKAHEYRYLGPLAGGDFPKADMSAN